MNKKTLTIIITFNAMPWIDKCIGSLLASNHTTDIHIYDNGSIDGTVDYIKTAYPTTFIKNTGKNLGFGKANNLGLKFAIKENYNFVFLLNQDAWIEPDALDFLIDASIKNPQYGIISPLHLNEKGDLEHNFKRYIEENKDLRNTNPKTSSLELNTLYDVPFINAALWLLPIKTIQSIGGFDPIFPHYGEDDDYVNRLNYHMLKMGVCPQARGVHARKPLINLAVEKRKYFEFIHYLVKSKKLDTTLNNSLKQSFRKIIYYSAAELVKLQMKRLYMDIGFLFTLIKLVPQLRRSRKESRKLGPSFL